MEAQARPFALGGVSAPFASISRMLVYAQPQNLLRSLSQRTVPKAAGPVGLLLLVLGFAIGLLAAVRAVLVKRAKSCRDCRGFGITRCTLCNGKGKVGWKAKFSYSEACPLCMAQRFVQCGECGGHHHRPIWVHDIPASKSEPRFGPA